MDGEEDDINHLMSFVLQLESVAWEDAYISQDCGGNDGMELKI